MNVLDTSTTTKSAALDSAEISAAWLKVEPIRIRVTLMFMMSRTFNAVRRVSGRHRHLTIREWMEGVSPWRGGNLGGMAFSPAVPATRRSQVESNFRGADGTVQLDLEPCRGIAVHAAMDNRIAAGSEVANRFDAAAAVEAIVVGAAVVAGPHQVVRVGC